MMSIFFSEQLNRLTTNPVVRLIAVSIVMPLMAIVAGFACSSLGVILDVLISHVFGIPYSILLFSLAFFFLPQYLVGVCIAKSTETLSSSILAVSIASLIAVYAGLAAMTNSGLANGFGFYCGMCLGVVFLLYGVVKEKENVPQNSE